MSAEQQPAAPMIPGDAIGLGVTVDADRDPVVFVWIAKEPLGVFACSLTGAAARQLAAGLLNSADQVDVLEGLIGDMSDEDIQEHLNELSALSGGVGVSDEETPGS